MVIDVDGREEVIDSGILEARILEVIRNSGGHSRLSLIADGIGRHPVAVNGLLSAMEKKGLLRQAGAWWRLTAKGERVPPETNGKTRMSTRVRGRASVETGIDYSIVLEDPRRRRDELDAAIVAIERLEA